MMTGPIPEEKTRNRNTHVKKLGIPTKLETLEMERGE